jgi:large repetitive protein
MGAVGERASGMSQLIRRGIQTIGAVTVLGALILGLPSPAHAGSALGKVYINDMTVTEGNAGATNATFTISLVPAKGTVTVSWATASGTATSGTDFVASGGSVTISKASPTAKVSVPVVGDTTYEPNETFWVNLSNPSGGTIGDAQGIGTITNDDPLPALRVNDVSVVEGDTGTTNAGFTVTLSSTSSLTTTVNYATAAGTASAPADYTSTSGSLSFAPGQTSKNVNVLVVGDTIHETNETFFLNLSGATNATIADAQGVGTITDDDTAHLSVGDVSVPEGNFGTSNATFTVSLDIPSEQTVTVGYATADGTATAGSDYTATSGSLSFGPGVTSKTVNVPVIGDSLNEADETFSFTLSSPSNAALGTAQATGTILNDDPLPALSVPDQTVTEGNSGTTTMTFTVSLNAPSGRTVSVHYATANGTAVAPSDYAATSGDLVFAPGDTSKQVDVAIATDTWLEFDETFTLTLSSPSNATMADGSAVGTILNDDAVPGISIDDVTAPEGNVGTSTATFTLTLSGPSGLPVSVEWATADGTATAGSDYEAESGTVSFGAGETTKQVSVTIIGDAIHEPNETFTIPLTNPTNAGVEATPGTGTILDDDKAPTKLTSGLKKGTSFVTAKGLLTPGVAGMKVRVTLFHKKGGRWVKMAAKTVTVGTIADRNHDGVPEAAYRARFKRPAHGSYRFVSAFAGDLDYLASTATKTFIL